MAVSSRDDERRLFEHFVIAGLDFSSSEQLSPSLQECGYRNIQPLAPITDLIVIFPSLGETMPEGFEMIATTPLGYPADLNHGSLRMPSVFIGFKRGYHKPPLIDIGVLDEGRGEKPMVDTNILKTTPFGRLANVNNASQSIFLTYRRASPNSAPSQFVVTDICVIMANKGEIPPHTYYKIPKNLNRGMVGWDVYLCYKKSQGTSKRLAYKPTVLDYFPKPQNDEEQFKLAQNIPLFCLPMGALIECWPSNCQPPDKSFTTFVLTDEESTKFYGAAVSFYEKYAQKLSDDQLEKLDLLPKDEGGAVEDSSSNNDPADEIEYHTNLAICLISRYPFFQSFKRFLYFIHRMSQGIGISNVPIERYLSHLRYEVSFPTPKRSRVLMTLGAEQICFESHDESQLPLNGAQHYETLKALGPDNLMYLMLLALLEQKILIHSLRSWLLTAVAESICSLMFPFHWQCPYVPQCPLSLAGVLHAPLPFIAGVDSRYFELYEDPPEDVTCFDLDTSTISASSARHSFKLSMLPKRAIKQLRATLENLYRKLSVQNFEQNASQKSNEFIPDDKERQWQKQKRDIETAIQEAFLKFMCHLMSGYQSFLRPIKSAPSCAKATDTGNLFDLIGFLRSRDKSGTDFFKKFCETQSFMRFIEERSFISDKNAYNAFFDDCASKVSKAENSNDIVLLETDSSAAEKNPSVFIAPPEPITIPETGKEREFRYQGFPRKLNTELFQLDQLNYNANESQKVPIEHDCSRCAAVRTKPEIRSSYLSATNAVRSNQMHWPKTLLFYAYSLWFMQLPSLLAIAPNKRKIIMLAFNILDRLEQSGVVLYDQVCYRIVIQLCGECGMPELAVKVLQAMQRAGLEQNAVTYGIYHRAVMDAEWPSEARQAAIKAWNRLRAVVVGASRFKAGFSFDRSGQEGSDNASSKSVSIKEFPTHTISVGPLSDESATKLDPRSVTPDNHAVYDPLGALSSTERYNDNLNRVTMSPSRAKFLAEHSSQPYASELGANAENKREKASSWLKGIANSPLMKMIRNQADTLKPTDSISDVSSITGSPSLQSLVTQVEVVARKKDKSSIRKLRHIMAKRLPGVSSRFRSGMSSLVQEVRSLNRSYGPLGSGSIIDSDDESLRVDSSDRAYQLDSGNTGSLLPEAWWMLEVHQQMRKEQEREKLSSSENEGSIFDGALEVTLSTCTPCPTCHRVIYDEEIMAGWKVDDQNLNTVCPVCIIENPSNAKNPTTAYEFAPQLTIRFSQTDHPKNSWYTPGGFTVDHSPIKKENLPEDFSLAFISPLVLRRELETWLLTDMKSLKEANIKDTHPIIFWNLVYYFRRLGLPTHLYNWIANKYHIRCVFDRPDIHTETSPLYFLNPNNDGLYKTSAPARNADVWKSVTQNVQENKLFAAMQALINDSRVVVSGQIIIGSHFPVFRDIQFASIDLFGRALVRDNLDSQYPSDWQRLPVRIRTLLPIQDHPQPHVHRACRKIFIPLDLV